MVRKWPIKVQELKSAGNKSNVDDLKFVSFTLFIAVLRHVLQVPTSQNIDIVWIYTEREYARNTLRNVTGMCKEIYQSDHRYEKFNPHNTNGEAASTTHITYLSPSLGNASHVWYRLITN